MEDWQEAKRLLCEENCENCYHLRKLQPRYTPPTYNCNYEQNQKEIKQLDGWCEGWKSNNGKSKVTYYT